ncbi:MAG: amino acid ABC transporter substrate-binding protein, partial [Alteromonadales bacterium]|nr:amino acid ABC transporter substrate-binding protein [Alteromonadales bacterium]
NTLQDLISQNIKIGQHQNWPDTQIMEANGLKLWKANKYSLLFDLLAAGRFDCFSRGANEVVQEFYTHSYKGLMIENHLIIYYPLPLYYFVNSDKPKLAERLTKGLKTLQKSGEYEAMFAEKFGTSLQYLKMQKRTIIELNNPLLTDKTNQKMREKKSYYDALMRKAAIEQQ